MTADDADGHRFSRIRRAVDRYFSYIVVKIIKLRRKLIIAKNDYFFKARLGCVLELIRECLNSHETTLPGGLFGILVG